MQLPRTERFYDPNNGFGGWRARIGVGRGIPTPALADGRVVFGGGFGSHDVYALDAVTGQLVWHSGTRDDGPTAASIVDGVVLFNTESCTLEAVDLGTGQMLWEKWLGDPLMAQPAANGHVALMAYPRRGAHVLSAFALRTGQMQWESAVGHDVITAPVIVDDAAYVSTFDGGVSCYDMRTGALRWTKMMNATSAPWVSGHKVYVAQRERPDAARSRRRRDASERAGAAEARERTAGLDARSGAAVDSDRFGYKPAAYLNAKWGSHRKSRASLEDAAVGFAQAPASAKMHHVDALLGESGISRSWRFQGSRPVVRDGVLFETTGDALDARDAATGQVLWSWAEARPEEGERRLTPPVVSNGRVFAGTWDGRLMSWDAADGRLRWQIDLGAPCHWQPSMAAGRIAVGLEDGSVACIETGDAADDGWPMWGGGPGHNG